MATATATVFTLNSLPAWLPASVRAAAAGGRVTLSGCLTRAERRVFKRRSRILPSVWAEKYRVVTMSAMPGPWRNAVTPYLAGIMDASFFPSVRMVAICAAPQTGKTEAIYNLIGYAADCDPGPAMVVMPDEITARDNSNDRIQPMFTSSARLSRHMTGRKDDASSLRINLKHMPIYMAWARSVSRLANKPVRYGAADEVDKYPVFASAKEASPVDLLRKRLTTFMRSGKAKLWLSSTPTIESGPIWQAMVVECEVVFDFLVVCPECQKEQVMNFPHIRWGESRDPEEVERMLLARYACEHCAAEWDDFGRDAAVRAGCWRERITAPETAAALALEPHKAAHGLELFEHLERHRPAKIAFHVPSKISPFVSLSQDAAAFLRGQKDKSKLRDWRNAHEALPWVQYQQVRKEDAILALRDGRPSGLVPSGGVVCALTAAIDTQDDGFWFEIGAWGWGMAEDFWQVRKGFVTSYAALEQVLWGSEYKDADGVRYAVALAVQDSGGHRTSEVYDFCRRHPGLILPTKGEARMSAAGYRLSKIDTYPGSTKIIPGGLQLLLVSANYYKDKLSGKLAISPADPGAWHLCADADEEWARQMTAEVIDEETRLWVNPKNRANHAWDCAVLNIAAADLLGLRFAARPAAVAAIEAAAVDEIRAAAGSRRW